MTKEEWINAGRNTIHNGITWLKEKIQKEDGAGYLQKASHKLEYMEFQQNHLHLLQTPASTEV